MPVINGLSDLLHPCQALADFFTLRERRGTLDGLKLAYVGDGNNVCHELMIGAVKLGVAMSRGRARRLRAEPAHREERDPRRAEGGHAAARWSPRDPMEAVEGADVVYTDVWTSMGQEAEAEARRAGLPGLHGDAAHDGGGGPGRASSCTACPRIAARRWRRR